MKPMKKIESQFSIEDHEYKNEKTQRHHARQENREEDQDSGMEVYRKHGNNTTQYILHKGGKSKTTDVDDSQKTEKEDLHIVSSNESSEETPFDKRLRKEYDFKEGVCHKDFKSVHRGVYLVETEGEKLVVKFGREKDEVELLKLARQFGFYAPDVRMMKKSELRDLSKMQGLTRFDRYGGILMQFMPGKTLQDVGYINYLHSKNDQDELIKELGSPENFFTNKDVFKKSVLQQFGKQLCFQIVTATSDRLPMPIHVGPRTKTDGNSGNVIVDPKHEAVIIIDPTATDMSLNTIGGSTKDYAESLRPVFRDFLKHRETGGEMIGRLAKFFSEAGNAGYDFPEDRRHHLVDGFMQGMDDLAKMDIDRLDISDEYKERMAAVRDVYQEELERSKAKQHKQRCTIL